jgi:phenylalanyl-tRNA synthetase alpha chain
MAAGAVVAMTTWWRRGLRGLVSPMGLHTMSMASAAGSPLGPTPAAVVRRPTRLKARVGPHTYEPYYDINGTRFFTDEYCNTTTRILEKIGVNLHKVPNHPLNILKRKVESAFPGFEVFDELLPVVTTFQNFDTLLIPEGHPARSPKDTYYLNKTTLMRPHTSAHQHDLLVAGHTQFLCIGDVYRRDEIDRTHFWCFHQCEGVKVLDTTDPKVVEADLKASLNTLVRNLFGDLKDEDIRWVDAYFPFTEPSFEMEIRWQGEWLEVLGCGIMQQEILRTAGADGGGTKMAWAFGIGLERIAMPLFKIPDIRIFWSTNKRFLNQFADGQVRDFQPLVSTKDYPASTKDVSMWLPEGFADTDFFDLVQNFPFSDLVEEVILFDEFTHPKTGRQSKAFRLVFRSPERTLTLEEVNGHMELIRTAAVEVLGVTLR